MLYRAAAGAFTLIELLVVVTIIAVLLALLTPGLDHAIAAAEMAKCGANLKAIGTASTVYASGNRRYYPKRFNYNWDALMMKNSGVPFDLRQPFQPYIGLASFVDPLLPATYLDDGSNQADCVIYSSYSVYTGWGIPNFSSQNKIGDRFSWQDSTVANGPVYQFDVLAADEDYRWPGNYTTACHQDKDGRMYVQKLQNQGNAGLPTTVPAVNSIVTICWWVVTADGAQRGPLDNQFVHADGNVQRINNIEMYDDRLAPCVVTSPDEYNQGRQAQLPTVNNGGK